MDNFIIIPNKIIQNNNLAPNAKLLLGYIIGLSRNTNECFASNEYLANLLNSSTRSVINWLKMLENEKFIKTELRYKNGCKFVSKRIIKLSENFYQTCGNFESSHGEKNFLDNNININKKNIFNTKPTKIIIENFILENNLNVKADKFYNYYDKRNFSFAGKFINWQGKLFEWHEKNTPTKTQPPLADWEIELIKGFEKEEREKKCKIL
ncbi:MAG: helix-turn-helix domain-containing protein [Clostridia bacterium]